MQYLVHIGYAKCGSTWLQRNVFSGKDPRILPLKNADGELLPGKPGYDIFCDSLDYEGEAVRHIDPFYFDVTAAREMVEKRTPDQAKVTCLSSELWAGHYFAGVERGRIYAERFRETLPEAKIMIVFRNQIDIILSGYLDYLKRYGLICSFENYIKCLTPSDINQKFNPHFFRYLECVKFYDSLYGKENVLALPMELMRTAPQEYVQNIYDFLGLDLGDLEFSFKAVNKVGYKQNIALSRFPAINLLSSRDAGNMFVGLGMTRIRELLIRGVERFTDAEALRDSYKALAVEKLGHYYRESNRELSERCGYDLTEFGYLT